MSSSSQMPTTAKSTRSAASTSKRRPGVTPGSRKRTERKYQIALHVHPLAKSNPNCDVKAVENPFIMDDLFLARTSFETIQEKVHAALSSNEAFQIRFAEYTSTRLVVSLAFFNKALNHFLILHHLQSLLWSKGIQYKNAKICTLQHCQYIHLLRNWHCVQGLWPYAK